MAVKRQLTDKPVASISLREDQRGQDVQWLKWLATFLEGSLAETATESQRQLLGIPLSMPMTTPPLHISPHWEFRTPAGVKKFWQTNSATLQRELRSFAEQALSRSPGAYADLELAPAILHVRTGRNRDRTTASLTYFTDPASALRFRVALALRFDHASGRPSLRRCQNDDCAEGTQGPRFFYADGKQVFCSAKCSNRQRQRRHYRRELDRNEKALQAVRLRTITSRKRRG